MTLGSWLLSSLWASGALGGLPPAHGFHHSLVLASLLAQDGKPQVITKKDGAMSVALSPDGKLVAWSGWGKTIHKDDTDNLLRVWDIKANKLLCTVGFDQIVPMIAFSPDSKMLASADYDRHSARLWDPKSGKLIKDLAAPPGMSGVIAVRFSPDGSLLFAGADLSQIAAWNIKEGKVVTSFRTEDTTGQIEIGPDAKWVVTGDWFGAKVWNTSTGEKLWEVRSEASRAVEVVKNPYYAVLSGVAVSANRYLIAVLVTRTAGDGGERVIEVWDFQKRTLLYAIRHAIPKGHTELSLAAVGIRHHIVFSPDGEFMAAIDAMGRAGIWNVGSKEQVQSFDIDDVTDMAFSNDGKMLAISAAHTTFDQESKGGVYLCPVKGKGAK